MTHDPRSDRALRRASIVLLLVHAASLVVLCWQQKLTPDEAHYVHAGTLLREELRFDAYHTVLQGPLALWPNQLGALFADPADFRAYAPFGRLGFVPITLLAALAVWRLAHRAFGARAAFAALLLWTTCPLVLAHGCLMTADMPLTCASLWTWERTWHWLRAPSLPGLLVVGVLLGATLATKYLGLLLVPALGLVLLGALAKGFAPRLLWSRQRADLVRRIADGLLATVLVAVAAWTALHTAYLWQAPGYEVRPAPAGVEVAPEDRTYGPHSAALRAVAATGPGRILFHLLPEPWVRGADYQKLVSEGLPTFFAGRVAPGFWTYYLVAFATKLPLLALGALLLGLFVRAPPWPPWLAWVCAVATLVPLVFLSGITRLQIGVRYALPVVPFLCLAGGRGLAALAAWRGLLGTAAAGAVGIGLVVGAATTWPRFLPAFNALAPRPYLWFMDSTLDWRADGPATDQDLAALRARHPDGVPMARAQGPSFGKLLVHGEHLSPRDPRDPGRVHHWLRRFEPVDHVGAWFAFAIDEAAFRAAVDREEGAARARATTELAVALLGQGDLDAAEAALRGCVDPDAARIAAAAAELRRADPAARAAIWLTLGRHDLVLGLGEAAPRALRAQALLAAEDAHAVIALLAPAVEELAVHELYTLASAQASVGRLDDALAVLERARPVDPAQAATHEAIARRLRQMARATAESLGSGSRR